MRDQRVDALAQILVRYSTKVQPGDVCVIQSTTAAEPLVQAIYEEVLRAGGLPIMQLTTDEAQAAFFQLAGDEQLDWVPPPAEWAAEHADVRIVAIADVNARALSQADPKKQARAQRARKHVMDTSMRRAAAGEHRWALTLFPTHAYAAEAGMSLSEYEDFYYAACLATDGEPLTAWQRQSDEVKRLTEWMQGREEVHITAPGHRHHARRRRAHLDRLRRRAQHARRRVLHRPGRGLGQRRDRLLVPGQLRRPRGRRREAALRGRARSSTRPPSAARHFLIEMLDTDAGARRLGELGIGTNYGIATGTKEILLDEKIGGTVHLAIGMSYPETGGVNDSAVHWDMVCDLRQGGAITVDGVELQRDGDSSSETRSRARTP